MEPILTPAGEAALTELLNYLGLISLTFFVVFVFHKILERIFDE